MSAVYDETDLHWFRAQLLFVISYLLFRIKVIYMFLKESSEGIYILWETVNEDPDVDVAVFFVGSPIFIPLAKAISV